MRMYKVFMPVILLVVLFQSVNTAQAQGGDQILDGIGETGMIARYVHIQSETSKAFQLT